jgi:hypothetical protein
MGQAGVDELVRSLRSMVKCNPTELALFPLIREMELSRSRIKYLERCLPRLLVGNTQIFTHAAAKSIIAEQSQDLAGPLAGKHSGQLESAH